MNLLYILSRQGLCIHYRTMLDSPTQSCKNLASILGQSALECRKFTSDNLNSRNTVEPG